MRDPKRIPKLLDELKGIWGSTPDLRLGQLIVNIIWQEFKIQDPKDAERKLYYIEDQELIEIIRKNLSEGKYIEPN